MPTLAAFALTLVSFVSTPATLQVQTPVIQLTFHYQAHPITQPTTASASL